MCQLPHLGETDPASARRWGHGGSWGPRAARASTRLLGDADRNALAQFLVREREVARRDVAAGLLVEHRLLDGAHLLALPAARVEPARRRRVRRARHVAAEYLTAALSARARHRHGRQQRARVRVARMRVEGLAVRDLDDL